jgi:hypothetical protein|tara:strand:- start:2067 stop:2216 length:150 start_codon:yes stop_codon:yes gene_type:complete
VKPLSKDLVATLLLELSAADNSTATINTSAPIKAIVKNSASAAQAIIRN